jgi:hypothetical protein
MIHHEGLHSHRPPGIENRQLIFALAALQTPLGASQSTHHASAQAERTGLVSVGSPKAEVGVGLKQQQVNNGNKRLPLVMDRNAIPRAQGGHAGNRPRGATAIGVGVGRFRPVGGNIKRCDDCKFNTDFMSNAPENNDDSFRGLMGLVRHNLMP